ncbi:MAG TPA: acyl-CoA dehydrogenase family protein [Actinomycetota bacterium]|nr:acyl-CoA dehydrogenase family protein [Actinomycetota bacterium]
MEFGLSEDQQTLKKSAREFLEGEAGIALARRMLEHESGFEPSLWTHMAELGWMGIAIPESEGGLGLGMLELSLLLEEMGRVALPSPYFSTVALAVPVVASLADAATRSEVLGAVAAGERKLTLAYAEASGAFDPAAIEAAAQGSGDLWTVTGTKMFVPDAHLADQIVVLARTGVGVGAFLVQAADCEISQNESLDRTRRLGTVTLGGVAARPLGGEDAWAEIERALDRAAVGLAAEATGVADAVMSMSVAYAKERQQFGRAIGSFQAVSHTCADMLVAAESARSTTYYAAWAIDEGAPDAPRAAATAKAAATTGAMRVCEDGIQVHGGIGFTWEHDMHLWYRRAKLCELLLGPATVWRERIASLL